MKTRLILDINKTQYAQLNSIVTGRVGDKASNTVDVYVVDGFVPYNLTGSDVYFECAKPDNTFVRDNNGVKIIDATQGYFEYTFPTQTFGFAGKAKRSFFSIEKNSTVRATTQDFELVTLADAQTNRIPSETYISELDELISEAADMVDRASGSPRGVYATLAALKAALPNGGYGIYIVSADGKWYYWNGLGTWVAGGVYQSTGVAPKSITENELSFNPIIGEIGKNMFDKSKVTIGKYVNWNSGTLSSNATYSVSDYIAINPNTAYTTSHNGQLAFYDANKVYVSGVATPTTFTTPTNASLVRISVLLTNLEIFQFEVGSNKTNYDPYGVKIRKDSYSANEIKAVIGLNVNEIVVAKSGGNFTKISDALASITNASADNKYRITVRNGTYIDTFRTKHHVDIVGENKYNTIIDYTGDINNWNSLSTIFGETSSSIENMTIIAKDCKYPIHSDAATGAYKLTVKNCVLDHKGGSDGRAGTPFGIGLYKNQHIELIDCELYANGVFGSAGVFFHNIPSSAGIEYRSLRVENCKIRGVTYGFRVNGISDTLDQKNDAFLINNDIQAELAEIMIDATTDLSWNVVSRGNTLFNVHQPNNNYIVQQPGYTKTYKNTGAEPILRGDVVLLNGTNIVITKSNAIASPLVAGVALEDIAVNARGSVQISGFVKQCKVGGTTSVVNNDLLGSSTVGKAEKSSAKPFAVARGTFTGGGADVMIPVILLPNVSN